MQSTNTRLKAAIEALPFERPISKSCKPKPPLSIN
jgi:hypothetical protein